MLWKQVVVSGYCQQNLCLLKSTIAQVISQAAFCYFSHCFITKKFSKSVKYALLHVSNFLFQGRPGKFVMRVNEKYMVRKSKKLLLQSKALVIL